MLGAIGASARRALRVRTRRCSAASRSTRPARRCPTRRSRPRTRPTRCCSPPSAARSGTRPIPAKPRPEQGLLGIRKALGLYANLRPVKIFDALRDASLAQARVPRGRGHAHRARAHRRAVLRRPGARDATSRARRPAGRPGMRAYDTMDYSEYEIERIARIAFEAARTRAQARCTASTRPTCSSRAACGARSCTASTPPSTPTSSSSTSSSTTRRCSSSATPRSSTSWSPRTCSATSSPTRPRCSPARSACSRARRSATARRSTSRATARAPDIAGQGVANPLAMLLSVELMLRYSFEMHDAADALAAAIERRARRGLAHARHRVRRGSREDRRHRRDGRPRRRARLARPRPAGTKRAPRWRGPLFVPTIPRGAGAPRPYGCCQPDPWQSSQFVLVGGGAVGPVWHNAQPF